MIPLSENTFPPSHARRHNPSSLYTSLCTRERVFPLPATYSTSCFSRPFPSPRHLSPNLLARTPRSPTLALAKRGTIYKGINARILIRNLTYLIFVHMPHLTVRTIKSPTSVFRIGLGRKRHGAAFPDHDRRVIKRRIASQTPRSTHTFR